MKQDDAHAAPDAEAVALQSQAIFENIPYEQVRLPGFKMPPEPQSSSSSSTLRPSPAAIARRQKLRDWAQRQAKKKLRLLDFPSVGGKLERRIVEISEHVSHNFPSKRVKLQLELHLRVDGFLF